MLTLGFFDWAKPWQGKSNHLPIAPNKFFNLTLLAGLIKISISTSTTHHKKD
jgi:hypothetical protein